MRVERPWVAVVAQAGVLVEQEATVQAEQAAVPAQLEVMAVASMAHQVAAAAVAVSCLEQAVLAVR